MPITRLRLTYQPAFFGMAGKQRAANAATLPAKRTREQRRTTPATARLLKHRFPAHRHKAKETYQATPTRYRFASYAAPLPLPRMLAHRSTPTSPPPPTGGAFFLERRYRLLPCMAMNGDAVMTLLPASARHAHRMHRRNCVPQGMPHGFLHPRPPTPTYHRTTSAFSSALVKALSRRCNHYRRWIKLLRPFTPPRACRTFYLPLTRLHAGTPPAWMVRCAGVPRRVTAHHAATST